MSDERSDELTPRERSSLEKLSRAQSPSAECEERVVAALRDSGWIREEGRDRPAFWKLAGLPRLAVGFAALAVAFVLGMEFGRRSAVPTPSEVIVEPSEEALDDGSGEMMAALGASESVDDPWSAGGGGKPALGPAEEEGFGEFPPYPLDGVRRSISPKYP
jgi:hypothetical protein